MPQNSKASRAEIESRNRELSVLNEVALAASQLLDLQEILDLALQILINRLGMQAGSIRLLDEFTGRLTLRASMGLSETQRQNIELGRQHPDGDLSLRVAQSGEAVFVPDMAVDARFTDRWPELRGRSLAVVPLKSRGKVVGTMAVVTHARQPLTERDVRVLTSVGHEIGIAIDNALLVAKTRRGEEEAKALYELGTQVSTSLELGQVLDAVAEGVRRLLASDIGIVGLFDEERQAVVLKATAGARTDALRGSLVPVSKELRGSALASGQPIIVEEGWRGLSMRRESDPIAAEGVSSFLAVPLRRGGRLLGAVGAMSRQRRHFTGDDVRLLTRLAHQVIVAIENAQLHEEVRRAVTLKERDRLARELHDNLAQALALVNIKASLVGDQLASGQIAEAQASLSELKQVTQVTYTDVREAIFSLHTAGSPGMALLPTLKEYVDEYQAHCGLETRLMVAEDGEGLAEFAPDVDVQLLRIIQEALANVRKHAGAGKAWVRFEQDADCVYISVEDDGRGFDPAMAAVESSRHFGLQIMRERAESVGARLDVESWPGQGTRVLIRVPRWLGGWKA